MRRRIFNLTLQILVGVSQQVGPRSCFLKYYCWILSPLVVKFSSFAVAVELHFDNHSHGTNETDISQMRKTWVSKCGLAHGIHRGNRFVALIYFANEICQDV